MPDWYYNRLKVCYECEFNSGNNEKISLIDKVRLSHNLGKDACLKCSCGVEDKCSSEIAQCPLPNPKWLARKVETSVNYSLKNNNPDIADLLFDKKLGVYYLDYGVKDKGSNMDVRIFINSKNKNITGLGTKASCSCTSANPKKINDKYYIDISYDKFKIGQIVQGVTISFKNNKKQDRKLIIKLRGEIK